MKKFFKIIALVITLATTPLLAGPGGTPGHSHEKITETKAIVIAKAMKDGLVKKGTIDNSWESVDASTVEQKKFGKNTEWLVTLEKLLELILLVINIYFIPNLFMVG